MSHFTTVRTRITDPDVLKQALDDLGFSDIEVHASPQNLYGYQGDLRPEQAEIIIRRQHIGPASNDIGFHKLPDGSYEAIISEYDQERFNQHWLDQLMQRYAYHIVRARLESQGFYVVGEETNENGQVHLVLRRVK